MRRRNDVGTNKVVFQKSGKQRMDNECVNTGQTTSIAQQQCASSPIKISRVIMKSGYFLPFCLPPLLTAEMKSRLLSTGSLGPLI